jgi:two-component system sensor histidine kinase/response regulator
MPNTKPSRLLIVDDEAFQLKALCNTLQDEGFITVGFSSPLEALATLRKQRFDLLLTDLMMPGMDGVTLMRAALEIDGDLVAILMTGQGTIDTAVEAMKAGALDYILKPFKLSAILPVLSRALAVRMLRHENAALAQRVAERTSELENANKELEAFAYSVSHDLRSPLSGVLGYSDLLETMAAERLTGEERQFVADIRNAALRMRDLIEDMLRLSKVSQSQVRPESFELTAMAREVVARLETEEPERRVRIDIEDGLYAYGDPGLLRIAVENLISNAWKYSRTNPSPCIEMGRLNRPAGADLFFVRDNGVGFPMQESGDLFQPFRRLSSSKGFPGTGVGLATVARVIKKHGGDIRAESVPGSGATFFFELPQGGVRDDGEKAKQGAVGNGG